MGKKEVEYSLEDALGKNKRRKKGVPVDRVCPVCGEPMPDTLTDDAIYCSADCVNIAYRETHRTEDRFV